MSCRLDQETGSPTLDAGVVTTRPTALIQVRSPLLDRDASAEIRTACLRSLDRGVAHIFVDLTGVTEICDEATDLLAAAAEELLAKHGGLWIANLERSPEWRPVPPEGLPVLAGLSRALDSALSAGAAREPLGAGIRGRPR